MRITVFISVTLHMNITGIYKYLLIILNFFSIKHLYYMIFYPVIQSFISHVHRSLTVVPASGCCSCPPFIIMRPLPSEALKVLKSSREYSC